MRRWFEDKSSRPNLGEAQRCENCYFWSRYAGDIVDHGDGIPKVFDLGHCHRHPPNGTKSIDCIATNHLAAQLREAEQWNEEEAIAEIDKEEERLLDKLRATIGSEVLERLDWEPSRIYEEESISPKNKSAAKEIFKMLDTLQSKKDDIEDNEPLRKIKEKYSKRYAVKTAIAVCSIVTTGDCWCGEWRSKKDWRREGCSLAEDTAYEWLLTDATVNQ